MLMSKNVNNDVSKDSPIYILLIIVDFKECLYHFKLLSFYIFLWLLLYVNNP